MIPERLYFDDPTANQNIVLTTKLQLPSSIHPLVSRPRLLQRLDQGLEGKLTLLCAPAGSGKTTLFADWLHSSHRQKMPVAWVSLDEGDNDPTHFWRYICIALEQTIGEHLSLLLQNSSHGSETMLTELMNLLAESAIPFVLVLDDYHLITTQSIHHALTFFIEHMPANMHLVLLTRFEPSLSLARLRVRGQLLEIRDADLRFTSQEVERFFIDIMKLPFAPAHIQALAERTEGWIAGLQLAALAVRDRTDIDAFITSFTGSSRYIVDYLLEEVIGRQTEDTQTFLLSTAILDRLCASLCASILGNYQKQEERCQQDLSQPLDGRHAQSMLEHLERTNLFLIPLDHERRWYRYHHLFAEALQVRLSLLHPSLTTELHQRASIWYEQQGLLTEAIEHALTGKNVLRACHLIEQASYNSTSKVSHWTFLRWVKIIPEDVIRLRPRLCFLHAWVLVLSGSSQWQTIERRVEEGMQGFPQDHPIPTEMIGEAAAIRATAACFHGEIEKAIIQGQEALRLLPASHWQQDVLLVILGSVFMLAGNIHEATRVLTHAIGMFHAKNLSSYFFVLAKIFLGKTLVQQGCLSEAVLLFQEAIEERGNQPHSVTTFAYGELGNVLFERNELDAAHSVLQQGVDLYQKTGGAIRTAMSIYIPLAHVQYARGEVDAAFATLTLVEQQAREDRAERLQAMITARRAHLHLRQGNIAAAVRWAEERSLNPEDALYLSSQADPREFEYLMLARVLIARGYYDQAGFLLKSLFQAAHTAQRHASEIEILVLQALNEQAQGAVACALSIMEHALMQARPQGYIRLFADEGEPMRTLLSRMHSKEQHIQTYVQTILAACRVPMLVPLSLIEGTQALPSSQQSLLDPLSKRELEALHLLAVGATNATIAQQLVIAPGTVKRHMSNIFSKLGVANRTQAVAQARDIGIL